MLPMPVGIHAGRYKEVLVEPNAHAVGFEGNRAQCSAVACGEMCQGWRSSGRAARTRAIVGGAVPHTEAVLCSREE